MTRYFAQAPPPVPPAPAGDQGRQLFRLPAYGMFAGQDQLYPVQFLAREYKFYLPFVVGFPNVTIPANGTAQLVYNHPSDSDFYVLQQFSYYPSNRQYAQGLQGAMTAVMRIPNVAEVTAQPVLLDILFPDQSMPPWTWDIPLIINAGDSLELFIVNSGPTDQIVSLALNGIRAYV